MLNFINFYFLKCEFWHLIATRTLASLKQRRCCVFFPSTSIGKYAENSRTFGQCCEKQQRLRSPVCAIAWHFDRVPKCVRRKKNRSMKLRCKRLCSQRSFLSEQFVRFSLSLAKVKNSFLTVKRVQMRKLRNHKCVHNKSQSRKSKQKPFHHMSYMDTYTHTQKKREKKLLQQINYLFWRQLAHFFVFSRALFISTTRYDKCNFSSQCLYFTQSRNSIF